MASEKQIAANRANAKHSTGPRTLAGKMKSSRNAFRHGLSGPLPLDPASLARIESITTNLAGENAGEKRLALAAEFAQVQLELIRIQSARAEQLAALGSDYGDTRKLRRLASLDRYERVAHTRRRRASYKLRGELCASPLGK
jgi:hypothetical protein